MTALTSQTFNYSTLDADTAEMVQHAVDTIRRHHKRAAVEIIEVGKELTQVKSLLAGRFIAWLDAEFGWTPRTAQNYMRAAEVFGGRREIISHVQPTALCLLASPSTPAAVVSNVIAKAASGEHITLKQIKQEVDDARWQEEQTRSAAELEAERRRRRARRRGTLTPATERRIERKRQKREEEQEQLRSEAARVAAELIDRYTAAAVEAILKALDEDWRVREAILDIIRGRS